MEAHRNLQRFMLLEGHHLGVENRIITDLVPLHWHNYFEIEIILSGEGKCIINQTEFDIRPGSTYCLRPTDFHIFTVTKEIHLIHIYYDEEQLSLKTLNTLLTAREIRLLSLDSMDFEQLVMATNLLKHECNVDGEGKKMLLEYILNFLFGRCSIKSSNTNLSDYGGITRAILFLQMHFREPISLEDLAKEAGYNTTYFSELFFQVTGKRYLEMLTELRINYACACLANGLSVSDACFLSGYNSLSNFLSVFKKNCHMTPRDYRKKHTLT